MTRPQSVDEYLAAVPQPQRDALERLRRVIMAAVPEAVETIAYDMPAYRLNGRFLLSFAASKRHLSLYPWSERMVEELGEPLRSHLSGRGTIRFTPEDPLPDELVRGIVRIRLAEVR
ncbi:MAG TPA: DUF1801 domain-containing protein [candidate division Zixibacteria bacterium]|nr:DUF1801 domain-containing protein [candidate division Zixibacteria bacterium]